MMMEELPPFFERCNKFPRSRLAEREGDWCSPSRRCHRVWGRAYQASVSFEALLENDHAAELLFHLLDASYQCDSGEEDQGENANNSEEGNEEHNHHDRRHHNYHNSVIIWVSGDAFITPVKVSTSSFLDECLDHSTDKLYTIDLLCTLGGIWIVHQPTTIAAERGATPIIDEEDTQELPRFADVMDVLLRLFARHNSFSNLTIKAKIKGNNGDDAQFPASQEALKDFVSEPQNERTISLQDAGLSLEQWHVVCSNSNKNVTIEIDYSKNEGSSHPAETAILHHCPANLDLLRFDKATPDKRQMVLTALESTTLLKQLYISFEGWDKQKFLFAMNTISRNHSMTSLSLQISGNADSFEDLDDLPLEEWELVFCRAIASHRTLQEVDVCLEQGYDRFFIPSREKDDILIKMLRQNTLLVKFDIDGVLEDKQNFDGAVNPLLECNRFRQVVQAIKQEANIEYRQQLFTATLFSDRVCRHPDYRYLLFKENFDFLKQTSNMIEGILLNDWEMTIRELMSFEKRKQSLETRMRDRGVAIPESLSEHEDEIHMLRGKKSKRSRLS